MPQSYFNPHKDCGGKWVQDHPTNRQWITQKCTGCGKRVRQHKRQAKEITK